jgi:phage tail tape-measure protein
MGNPGQPWKQTNSRLTEKGKNFSLTLPVLNFIKYLNQNSDRPSITSFPSDKQENFFTHLLSFSTSE